MSIFQRIADGAARATGMMERLGIDPDAVLGDNPIHAANNLRSRALGCTFCKGNSECAQLLASNDNLTEAPAYCPNKRELDALAQA